MNEAISKVVNFLQSKSDPLTTLRKYTAITKYILYTEPDIIKAIVEKMRGNIQEWAVKNSSVYSQGFDKIYTKEDFSDKENWYISSTNPHTEYRHATSSGSTTGECFYYRITKKYHSFLEDNNQYGMILKEFGLPKQNLKILSLIPLPNNPTVDEENFGIMHFGPSNHAYHGHRSRSSIRHFVKFDESTNTDKWYQNLIEYVSDKNLDVILSNAPIINGIKNYLARYPTRVKLCKLLSHTTQFPIKENFIFLKDNGYIDNYCDSMRCWDGGATFFTCKYGTYHLMDSLSYVFESDKKLISTDYFSLPSPFINYWNGDFCEIEDNYKKCECQRWYRPFKMLQSRPFDIKGPQKLTEIKEKIYSLSFSNKIQQIQFYIENVKVISKEKLNDEEKKLISNVLDSYKVIYTED